MKVSGIYQIINIVTCKKYIGSAIDIDVRWKNHKKSCRSRIHENSYFQNAWNKYGEQSFQFQVLEKCEKEKLLEREQYWLDFYKSYERNNGYNICCVAGSSLGIKRSEETRKKISVAKKGWVSPMRGTKMTNEMKKKLSEAHKGIQAGEKHPAAILTWEKVREIRQKYLTGSYSYNTLAKEYDVEKHVVGFVVTNKTWKEKDHIEIKREKREKLNWDIIREIRNKYEIGNYFQRELSKEYNISLSNISRIVNNITWKENI